MNRQLFFIITVIAVTLTGCHKKHENNYSFWQVNNDSLATNDTYTEQYAKQGSDIVTNSRANGFAISFQFYDYFPAGGQFRIVNGDKQYGPYGIEVVFYYKDSIYLISKNQEVYFNGGSNKDGKPQYILPQAWYVNQQDSTDSVLISAQITAP